MHVRFNQVEVCTSIQYINATVHTRKKYEIDCFELKRKNKRRTKKQFHKSDLYREWIIKSKQMVTEVTGDDKKMRDTRSSFFDSIEKLIYGDDVIALVSSTEKISVKKIMKAEKARIRRQQRRRERFKNLERRGSCFSAVLPRSTVIKK